MHSLKVSEPESCASSGHLGPDSEFSPTSYCLSFPNTGPKREINALWERVEKTVEFYSSEKSGTVSWRSCVAFELGLRD